CAGCTGEVSGLAVSPDGRRLLVANMMNDSVSLLDVVNGRIVFERDLRPGVNDSRRHGIPGGSYPRAVAWSSGGRAYVASERDREVISLAVSRSGLRVLHRVALSGQPVALLTNRSGSRLYVALDSRNQVAVIDTQQDKLVESFDVVAPPGI